MKPTPALAAAIIIAASFAAGQSSDRRQGAPSPAHRLPIMTWPGPETALLSPETFRLVVEAGFSVNFSTFGARDVNLKALDLARAAGLTLMIHDGRIEKLLADETLSLDPLDGVAADYKSHPALFGYFITDEPNAAKFPRLGAIVARLKAADPRHPSYINLFPTYANEQQLGTKTYEEHLKRYVETVRPPFVSYDHYPVMKDGFRKDYYRNLEIIRGAALANGLDFWAFTLCTPHVVYPPPTAAHIRLQLFSDIAYGAKGLQYFTYGTPGGSDEFGVGLVDREGRPGPAYSLACEVNAEIRRIEDLVLRWTSLAVFHSEPVPEGAHAIPAGGIVTGVSGAPLVMGIFTDRLAASSDKPAVYVMFVNRDYERPRTAVVSFGPAVRGAVEVDKGARPPSRFAWPAGSSSPTCVLDFAPGDARIFRLK